MPARPLDDIRVLDLTHFYNGPYGTLLLSYLGADVIKVEPPGHGEGMRALYRAPGRDISLGFAILNVNKRSVTLNLKSAEGCEIFKRMVARADVVAENFAYGAMEGFGLGYDVLRAINPRLIYATGKGYGLSGPYRDLPAFDPVVQAMSGVLATTGEADGPPMKAGPAVVDMLGGVHLAAAILAALRGRDRTGEGMLVEVALQDAIVPTLTTHIGAYYGMGITSTRDGNRSAGGVIAPYNVYPASEGYVMILAADHHRWRRLCELMGRPELIEDQRFVHLRPDVLSWSTEPLKNSLVVAGDVVAHLLASTSGTDSDWIVKLIDVYPENDEKLPGYQLMIDSEVYRARFRNSFEKPEALRPNQPYEYAIDIHATDHEFRPGHRVMVQVQSSWFPLIDRNPQKFVENIYAAKASDYQAATQKIFRSSKYASYVELPVRVN